MNNAAQLAHRVSEVFLNGTWIANTNYRQELAGLNWNIATAAFGALNSIALLAQHVHYYLNGVKNVLKGGGLDISDQYSFDFPPIASHAEWESFLNRLFADAAEFADSIAQMPEAQLTAVFVDEKYGSYQRNIDALIEHAYYHLGQIVLLRKLVQRSQD